MSAIPVKQIDDEQIFLPIHQEQRTPKYLLRRIGKSFKTRTVPSKKCSIALIRVLFPFLSWMKEYQVGWLPSDLICGVTVAIMQIPQGMAYALLARLPAVFGLYISFFPSLIYPFFGTSRHLSMGSIAVISLMTGNVIDRMASTNSLADSLSFANNITNSTENVDQISAINIGTTLAFTVGLVQFALSILHLGFITAFFSSAFVSGYTTGTAFLVLTSQVPDIFGLTLKRYAGPLNVIYTYIEIFRNLPKTNIATLIISLCSLLSLVVYKEYFEAIYKKQIKKISIFRQIQIPIPVDLLVIIGGTLFSHFLELNRRYSVKIVNTIDRGFQAPTVPSIGLVPSLLKDGFIIGIVSFSIAISLAKTFAEKFHYSIDSNRELTASGFCNIIGSFFSTFPCGASLSRTSVFVNAGGRTQLASIVSSIFLLIIILRIGPLFEPLPKACLASIIVVALKNVLLQAKDFIAIARLTKLEGLVWLVTCLSTIILDVDYGLIVGIAVSLIVVILRSFRPRLSILGSLKSDGEFYTIEERDFVKIVRFESSLIYYNADYFRETLMKSLAIHQDSDKARDNNPQPSNLIIDASAINQLDFTAATTLLKTIKALNDLNFRVYLTSIPYFNQEILRQLQKDTTSAFVCKTSIIQALQEIENRMNDEKVNKF